ncbi:RHS repeat-associated core domain-containing protein [Pseudomonas sp. BW16M2]|uniref:RHS repeat-associated core domain-containing protein n=1 Tax=Pseudomonas sp. BW16M2 TaxID=2745489 RepID=UPI001649103F|nr:RHS repeat-associated core domain-containing protein [Pseudomonas sp. BW16M2]MBC3437058.1 RHS repeat-associated core domain-containing protein [Pseudomonas sp. BW16M2]
MSSPATRLLASDLARSVLRGASHGFAYLAYGYDPVREATYPRLGFNGVIRDPQAGGYLLGNGYRAYSTVLMRFCSPDRLSPFADGGMNSYGYCAGDPINHEDPRGAFKQALQRRSVDLGQLSDLPKSTRVDRVSSVHHTETEALQLRYPGYSDLINEVTTHNALSIARTLPSPDRIAGAMAGFTLPNAGITSDDRDLLADLVRQLHRAVVASRNYVAAPNTTNQATMREQINDYSKGKEVLIDYLVRKMEPVREIS